VSATGGLPTFASPWAKGQVAPIRDLPTIAAERGGSALSHHPACSALYSKSGLLGRSEPTIARPRKVARYSSLRRSGTKSPGMDIMEWQARRDGVAK
jgi:hypothetical protein